MKKEVIQKLHKRFEDYAHTEQEIPYWYARELQDLLGYFKWENFLNVIEKATISCQTAGQQIDNHFRFVSKRVEIGSGVYRDIEDIALTRYACYLIAQNGDPHKEEIAFAQTYFAVQTRKQEIIEQRISEIERLRARQDLTASEKELSQLIFQQLGDQDSFGRIRSKGDQALFGGFTTSQMKKRLSVPDNRPLADFLPTITIRAKDFANEISNFNIKKDDLSTETQIAHEHVKNNSDVRTLLVNRGIHPEQLPPAEDLKKVERRVQAEQKKVSEEIASISEFQFDNEE